MKHRSFTAANNSAALQRAVICIKKHSVNRIETVILSYVLFVLVLHKTSHHILQSTKRKSTVETTDFMYFCCAMWWFIMGFNQLLIHSRGASSIYQYSNRAVTHHRTSSGSLIQINIETQL